MVPAEQFGDADQGRVGEHLVEQGRGRGPALDVGQRVGGRVGRQEPGGTIEADRGQVGQEGVGCRPGRAARRRTVWPTRTTSPRLAVPPSRGPSVAAGALSSPVVMAGCLLAGLVEQSAGEACVNDQPIDNLPSENSQDR